MSALLRAKSAKSQITSLPDGLRWPWTLQSAKEHSFISGERLNLIRPEGTLLASLKLVVRGAESMNLSDYFTIRELEKIQSLAVKKRREEFIWGRLAAKVAELDRQGETNPHMVEICSDIFGRPLAKSQKNDPSILSLSHSKDVAVAISAPQAHPLGLDIEAHTAASEETIKSEMTPKELILFSSGQLQELNGLQYTLNWTIKESYSKAIGVGLTSSFRHLEVNRVEIIGENCFESWLTHFSQFRVISWIVRDYVLSLALPYKTHLDWQKTKAA